jgi:hypothetical protein
MRSELRIPLFFILLLLFCVPRAAAFDWDPVTDTEKNMTSNPLDPGSGALVLFKRGDMDVLRINTSLWETRIVTYTRIKILTDAGRDAGNVVLEAPKYLRYTKIEGRTILPSGEIIPLDTSKIFHGVAYQSGNSAVLSTSFAFSSAQPGAIIEYQTEEYEDWFFPPAWIFDTRGLATLQSSLKTTVTPELGMGQLPLGTTANNISATQKQTSQGVQTDFAVQNLRPLRDEPFAVPFRDRAVMVMFSPVALVFSGQVIPIVKTWDDVADQVSRMVTEMTKNNKEATGKAKEVAEKLPDPRSRAEAIYKYLQQNITSSDLSGIAMGSRSVDQVISQKRGDPDEINAVFMTMLKEVKVDADLVVVATQNWQTLVKQFPALNQLSRVFVRVNLKEGPVFADAADAAAPFGELPWFERGVPGMVVKGTKVQNVEIPAGLPEDNVSASQYSLQLSSDWRAEGDAELNLKGAEAIDFRSDLIDKTPDKAEQRLSDYFGLGRGDAVISGVTHPDFRDTSQPLVVKAHVQHSVAEGGGPGEVLLNPWMGDQYRSPEFKSTQRQSIILFENPMKEVTTSTWKLPLDIQVEKLPSEVNMQGDIADFSHSCTQSGDTVTCTRTFVLKKTLMNDPHGYPATKKFFDEVAQHDQEVVLLRKQ